MAATTVVLLVLSTAMPPEGALGEPSFPLSWLRSLLAIPSGWAGPAIPPTPKQVSGTAAGRGHSSSYADTRAGGGAGRAPGAGAGELPAFQPASRRFTQGQSAGGRHGFDAKTSVRVASKSTATSTYYTNADGSTTRRLSPTPVNYRDAHGNWQPIVTTVRPGADGRWRQEANDLDLGFAPTAADPRLVSVALGGGGSLAYGIDGAAAVPGRAEGSTVTYPGALPQTDVRLTSTPAGMREDLVLHSADAGDTWRFPLELHGVSAEVAADGSVVLTGADGHQAGRIPPSYAYDSAVDPRSGERPTTHATRYELTTVDGQQQLVLTVDAAWLRDKARVFPVVVDPSYTNTQAITTYVSSGTVADHSMEDFIKIGSYDSGTHSANSFLKFPASGIDNSQISVSAASLDLFVSHANGCPAAQRLDVAPVAQDWTPSTLTTYPGPTVGASIGNLTPTTPNACANTAIDPQVGDWVTVPLSTATFTGWANGSVSDFGLAVYASTTDSLHWKYLGSAYSEQPNLSLTYDGNVLPQIIGQGPANGAVVTTRTPQLSAQGTIDSNVEGPGTDGGPQFQYQIYNAGGAKVADSGLVNGSWIVPAGKLEWGKTYTWTVQAFDGANFTPDPVWHQLVTQVPQPTITSSLAQNTGGKGFDQAVGNYTTSETDAEVDTVGPALSVVRDYNSRDPRASGSFGAGWSSLYDMRATERYDSSGAVATVVVTYPEGSQVGYGRNADGTFTAPLGRAAKLVRLTNGYELFDKSDTTYRFTQSLGSGAYGIGSVTDASDRTETFTWSGGHITAATSATSGRKLTLTWVTPTGASTAHVQTVVTDPASAGQPSTALTWTYAYSGDQLTSVCPPGTSTACTRYGYTTGSPYHTQVLDQGPKSYWPLTETSGSTAASAVIANEGADTGTYTNVTLAGATGPRTGGTAKAPTFNGSSSQVFLGNMHTGQALTQSVSLWFRTTATNGVLFSSSDMTVRPTITQGNFNPTLYIGSSGKLHGEFWQVDYAPTPITTAAAVNDGAWHHVVLTCSQTSQVMYLDGAAVGSMGGWDAMGGIPAAGMPWLYTRSYLGTGFLGGLPWPDNPYTNDATTAHAVSFNGAIADASYYDTQLSAPDVSTLYQAAKRTTSLLTSITRPSGNTYATVTYDPATSTVTNLTDENGGRWSIAAPTVSGSSQVYRSSVLGGGPLAYYRLGEAAGAAQAISEVRYDPATYSAVTLGGAGRFDDQPAASFDGTSSYVQPPTSVVAASGAQSYGLWFRTTQTGGVLLSTQDAVLGAGGDCGSACQPLLWVAADGTLHGLAPSATLTGPLTGKIPGKCVDDWGSGTDNGNTIDLYTCNGTGAQNWTLASDGSLRVLGKCLDVTSSGTTNGTKVQLYTCNQSGAQVWEPYNGGLRNPQSGKCLDDPSSSKDDGTQLQIYTCNGTAAQQWTLSLASSATVNDGRWHHAVLTSTGTGQALYLDGVKTQWSTGSVAFTGGQRSRVYLGGGDTGTGWSNLPAGTTGRFAGGIAEVAFYPSELPGAAATAQFEAGRNASGLSPMTTITVTDPGDNVLTYRYDPLRNNRLVSSTDGRGYTTSYGYDTSGFLYTTTDPNGAVTTTGHDAEGNEITKTTCQNQAARLCSTTFMTYKSTTMGVDQAKGAAVTSSSSYVSGGWKPAAVVDGNTTSVSDALGWTSASSTSANTTQWVQLDLGSARTLNRVDLYPRTDAMGAGFPQAFTVAVSADGSSWSTVTTQTNYPKPTTPAAASFGFTARSVRYVKVNATTLRTDGSSSYFLQFAEIEALNDLPDPTAGLVLTQRDPRSSSATDDTYLTSYTYDAVGNATGVTSPPVPGYPNGRTNTVAYTDGTTVLAADTGYAPAGLPYRATSAGGSMYTVTYLHTGDVAATTDAAGQVTRYTYDNLGRVATKTVNPGKPNGWWRLDQSSGTAVADSSGLANTGTATGVTWSDGAGVFNGSARVAVPAPVINTGASYTVSAWVNLSSIPTVITPVVAGNGTACNAFELAYSTGLGTWKFQVADQDVTAPTNAVLGASAPPAAGTWYHLVGVHDAASGTATLYVNGAADATGPVTKTFAGKRVTIGTGVPGSIANVQLYQRPLSADEVSTLYAAGRSGSTTVDTTPSGMVTSYGYDGEGRVVDQVDPPVTNRVTGAVHRPHTTTVFDPDGNMVSQTVADDSGGDAPRTRTMTYNAHDQLQTSTDAKQNVTSFTYDGFGNKTSETDALGTRTTYGYDANGHLLTQTLDNFTGDPVDPQASTKLVEVSRAYDPAGRLASVTNAMGATTAYTYTDNGLPVTATRTDKDGKHPFVMKQDVYDAAGNIVSETTNNGATTTTTALDAASRPTRTVEDPGGQARTTVLSYTADDQVATSTRTGASGATLVTSATYDPMGRETSKSVVADGSGHPVGWWPLTQGGGTTVADASGTGNTASATSGVKWTGSGAQLNGTTGAVTTTGPVLTTTASYSVSAWVNLAAVPSATAAVVSQDATVAYGFNLQYSISDQQWAFAQGTSDTPGGGQARATGGAAPTAGTWYHLVGTFDASTGAMTLYVDGDQTATATNATPIAAPGPLAIGRARYNSGSLDYLNGQVADVQVYQRVLSGAEVSTLYGAGRAGGTVASSRRLTTSWRLDQRGVPLSMTDANGNTTNYTYDEAGQLVTTVAPTVPVEATGGTSVPARPVTLRGYDTFGDPTEEQDADGNTVTTAYDANGRPVSTTLPPYTPPGSSTALTPVTTRTYDALGNLVTVSDPLHQQTSYVYDQLGNVAQVTDPRGGVTHSTYNLNGERLSTTDPNGARAEATYDHLGRRVTATAVERHPSPAVYTTTYDYTASAADPGGAWLASETSPDGVVTSYGYDRLGDQVSVTDGARHTTTYAYDHLGRRTSTRLADGSSTTATYDEAGNLASTSTLDPAGAVLATQSATYDAVGNTLSTTDARHTTIRYTYDALSRLAQEVQPTTDTAAITTTYGYDAAGNRTRFTDGRGNAWAYGYNPWNQQETEVEPATATYGSAADRTFTTAYDILGRPVRQTQPGGVSLTAGYNELGQVTSQSGAGAEAATADRSFDYDAAGRMTSAKTGAAGGAPATAETFTYDDRGLLLTAAGAAGDSSFSYTGDGLMRTRTDAAGMVTYGYDTADRLATLTDPATGALVSYGYNALDQVTSIGYGAGGDRRVLDYDARHRLRADTLKTQADAVVASITYGYDDNSNLTSKTTTGFAGGSATNTYTYDLADRITSWTGGSGTVAYEYDASGNRTRVGANVYTYDARDQLTGDGATSYTYTARGTLSGQSGAGGAVTTTSDAYGQTITQGGQTYGYDASGRLLTAAGGSGQVTRLAYSGPGNIQASDGSSTYTRDPSGGLVGIGTPGSQGGGVFALLDLHTDVVGDFTPTGAALAGSTTYDPFGTVLATASQTGNLGYQSGWTDPATKRVNMAARWYNPAVGQFTSRDTVEQAAAPNSADFNPFAYAADNPMTGVDPGGHGWWSSVKRWGSSAWHTTVKAWHATTHFVSTYVIHPIARAASNAWNWARNTYQATINRIKDAIDRQLQAIKRQIQRMQAQIRALNAAIKKKAQQARRAVATAYHATAHATAKAVSTATTFVKHHAAAVGAFVVSTAVFMGCEAVLGVATGGVGAVAGAVACGALSGAVGGMFEQGAKCFDGQKGACSAGSFLKAGLIGGAVGGLAGLGGALGGKVLSAVGGKAMRAVGGLFGRGGARVAEGAAGAAEGAAANATRSTVDTAAEAAARGGGRSAAKDAAEAGARRGGEIPRGERPSGGRPSEQPRAGEEPGGGPSCKTAVHSFTGSTPVLMAGGATKPIDQVKVGDTVVSSVPGDATAREHTVQAVIVTATDHDFVDVTVARTDRPARATSGSSGSTGSSDSAGPSGTGGRAADSAGRSSGSSGRSAATAALVTALGVVALAGATLTTTYHHPFYDSTRAAFVDAKDLRVGDELQTADGGGATVTAIRLYHANQLTYDLTIDGLHTYYVTAGTTPVLVHNCGYANNQPENWAQESAAMQEAGFSPATSGTSEFDAIMNSGDPFLWAVRTDGTLAAGPQNFNGLRVTHSMLANGDRVLGAGMAQRPFAGGAIKLNAHSGHYYKDIPEWRSGGAVVGVGRDAFERLGIPAALRELGLVR